MGRKNRRPNERVSQSSTVPSAMPPKTRKKLDQFVDQLLQMCTTGGQTWEEYTKLYTQLEKVQDLEKEYNFESSNREEHFDSLLKWLSTNGASWKSLEIRKFDQGEYGLNSKCNIKEGDQWLVVPRKVMLTTDTAKSSSLGILENNDPLLQHMPNVMLSLHLLNERFDPESFWSSYIKTLPEEYDTPMYFTPEEMNELKGSPAFEESIKQCRNIARQYAYFYRLFKQLKSTGNFPVKDRFTYNNYRWAVSAVMTRQNSIPSPDGSSQLLALVPLWDMCNHSNGKLATDYNLNKDQIESYAFRGFKENEQIFMFYGVRSNAELVVHNGFVYPDNEHDCVMIKLDLRKSDPLYSRKEELLAKLEIPSSGSFAVRMSNPIDGSILAFHRVAAMNQGMLDLYSEGERWRRLTSIEHDAMAEGPAVADATVASSPNDPAAAADASSSLERLCWLLLETRLTHLLHSYATTKEEDEQILTSSPSTHLTGKSSTLIRLRMLEKKILTSALVFVAARREQQQVDATVKRSAN